MTDQIKILGCPFCGGPPVTIITTAFFPRLHIDRLADYGEDGLSVEAHVYCHECGGSGEIVEDEIYDAESFDDVMLEAIGKWNTRGKRHADLYESSDRAGRNLYPGNEPS